ncbi:MAG: SIMPL domain-containing protein [Chitinophagaceae bacterium]|nr:MAG: SIMPL domain-containing protein [Chitinophagaceae bacterium]
MSTANTPQEKPSTISQNMGWIAIAIAICIAAYFISNAYRYKFKSTETIRVNGSAQTDFTSDLIVWNGSYSRNAMDIKEAYTLLKSDEDHIKKYLTNKGISAKEIVFSAVKIDKLFNQRYDAEGRVVGSDFTGFSLSQNVKIESTDIPKIEQLSREVTQLIESGIELKSSEPLYFYTKIADLKLDLLAKASEDAKKRAEIIAKNTGGSISGINKANMGIFQITGKNSDEDYSYGGAFNTSSKNKTASITVSLECNVK